MPSETPPNPIPSDPKQAPVGDYRDHERFSVEAAGHVFTFYPEGCDRLDALIEHVKSAKHSLELFYFEFQNDGAGQRMLDALVKAADRGVKVSLIIDSFGSDAPLEFFEALTAAGAHFAVFAGQWNRRYLVRNHQKFAVADNARVMTGGSNISDEYYNPPMDNGWCDLGVAIEGEVVQAFSDWFAQLDCMTRENAPQFRELRRCVREYDPGNGNVQLLLGGPLLRRSHWSYHFKKDMAKALRLDMVSAYFGPPRSFRRAMARIAKRGEARLVAAGKSDLDGTIDAARLYYKGPIKSGATVSEFQPSKLHMKLLVVDDVSYFGSANLDRRSIRINMELMVRVKDKALADRLRSLIDHLDGASHPIDREWYASHAGLWTRARWRLFSWLSLADYRLSRSVSRGP